MTAPADIDRAGAFELVGYPHGSIILVRPGDDDVRRWLEEHTEPVDALWLGGALVVEPRYLPDIVEGLVAYGFRFHAR